MSALVQASYYRPRIFPIKNDVTDAEIDRAQSIDPSATLNAEIIEEIGTVGSVGSVKGSSEVSYGLTQYEYGNIEFWQKLVNTATLGAVGQTAITQDDFKTPYSNICAYMTDDDGTFLGTVLYPELRTSGFSLSISDPQAIVERSFDLVGESAIILQNTNKYYIYERYACGSGGDNEVDLSTRAPIVDPDNAGVYMFKVYRVRGAATTELTLTTDYTYSNITKILTIVSVQAGDVIKAYYSSATAPATMFTTNTVDVAAIRGDSVDIYLYVPASGKPSSADYAYRLQSVSLDVSFDRLDLREIGNDEVVARGVTNTTVTATLGRLLETFTIEEVLRGQTAGYGKIDISQFSDEIALIIKIYSDNTKTSFKYGFMATGMTTTDIGGGVNVAEYVNREGTIEGKSFSITADSTLLV